MMQLLVCKCRWVVGICGNALEAGEWPRPLDSQLDLCLGHFPRQPQPLLHVYPCPPLPPPPPAPSCTTTLSPAGPLPKAKVIKLACCYFRHFKMQISSKLCPSQACLIAPVGAPGVVRSEKLGASRSCFWINCAPQNNEQFSPHLSTAFIRLPPIQTEAGMPARSEPRTFKA